MPQPWFLGMDDGDMPMKPVQWTEHGVSAMAEQQRHDELLRMQCLREAFSDLRTAEQAPYTHTIGGWHPPQVRINSPEVLAKARVLFRELTGREWPVWPEPQINP